MGKKRYSSTYLKTVWGISGYLHIPSTLSPGRVPISCRINSVGSRAGVAMMK